MDIKIFPVGMFQTNCYIVISKNKDSIIIDPGADCDKIIEFVKKNKLNIKHIINTHGHHDHTGCNNILRKELKAPLSIHELDLNILKDSKFSLSAILGSDNDQKNPDAFLKEGLKISFGDDSLVVIHTPGHTPGGVCLYSEEKRILFSGDTLFFASIGRTDLPGGDYETLINSLNEKIIKLPEDTNVFPGHGPNTNIQQEKNINPFLR